MKNLKISKKLILSYGVVLILLVVSIAVSIFDLVKIQSEIETFYNGPFTVKGASNTLNAQFEEMQKSVFRAISNEDAAVTDNAIADAKAAASGMQEQLRIIDNNFLGDEGIVERLKAGLEQLAPMRESVLQLAAQNRNAEAADFMEQNNIPVIEKTQQELKALISASDEKGEALIDGLRSSQTKALIVLSVLGVFSTLISVGFGVYISKSITRPTVELHRVAEQISNGDLEAVVSYQAGDELGQLADSMRTTVSRLSAMITDLTYLLKEIAAGNFDVQTRDESVYVGAFRPLLLSLRQMSVELSATVRQINQSSAQVSVGSEQVSSGAQTLAQGAAEQASSVEELAATIEDVSGQVRENASGAAAIKHLIDATGEQVVVCNQQMQEMVTAMSEISSASQEIRKIIATIENIAFQTNILALNAAVEAARAGSAGKGFAVVADEVRSLANKSQEASNDTSALIERSIQLVQNGTQAADETAKTLLSVVDGAKEITCAIEKISRASETQAASIQQVTLGMEQISSVIQTNSATAEESAAASEELSGQAELLSQLVSRFKLREEGCSPAAFAAPLTLDEAERRPVLDQVKY